MIGDLGRATTRRRSPGARRAEGIDALLVMWQGASEAKIAATRGYGAEVDLESADPAEAFERLDELIEQTGRTLVHPFDDPLDDRRPGHGRARDASRTSRTSTWSSSRSAAAG